MLRLPAAPSVLPSVQEIDDYLEILKQESRVWREFRKVVDARENPKTAEGDRPKGFVPEVQFGYGTRSDSADLEESHRRDHLLKSCDNGK